VAFEPGIATRTIKVHRAQAMEKKQAASVAELVCFANELRERGAPLSRLGFAHPAPSRIAGTPAR
jgi:hypothetical protein